jgi:spore maturation protein CgeB
MRIQTISTKYRAYWQQFYARHPKAGDLAYGDHLQRLLSESFGAGEIRTQAFAELGYETGHIFANAELLQKRWAHEQGLAYDPQNWMLEIAAAQVKAFQPEILFLVNYSDFKAPYIRMLREIAPSIRLVVGWCGAPYNDPQVFQAYDIVLSNVPELVSGFLAQGHRAYHVNHAFDPRILQAIDAERPPTIDFAFAGSIIKSAEFHLEREKLLLALVEQSGLQIWSETRQPTRREQVETRLRQAAFDGARGLQRLGLPNRLLQRLPVLGTAARRKKRPAFDHYVDPRLARRAHPPVYGLEMFQLLHDSRISLNTHIDISSSSASNMRLYEASGVGTCLLTDWKDNLPELFEPDVEVVAYRSAQECIEKARYLLEHEDERARIAAAGQQRTLRDHTVLLRVQQIDEIIRSTLAIN